MANTFQVVGDLTVAGTTTRAGTLIRTNGAATYTDDLAVASTADATATTVATLPVPASGSVTVNVMVQGIQSDGSNGFEQFCNNSARRNGAAAPTLSQGLTGQIVGAALENTFTIVRPSVQFVISGNDMLIQVVGKAATNINWALRYNAITR